MGFFIIILLILLLPLIFPYIGRMVKGYFMGKMEDNMRRMMGMPSRAEEKKARKREEREQRNDRRRQESEGSRRYGFRNRGRNHNVGHPSEDLRMMQVYAEDVEFVEIREYSAEIRFEQDERTGNTRVVYEEQVSDAEFIVIA